MNIIGLNDVASAHHNSSMALVQNGKLTFAASEERFTRIKHDMAFAENAIRAALEFSGLQLNEIDYFAVGYPMSAFYGDLLVRNWLDLPRTLAGLVGHNFSGLLRYLLPNIRKMYNPPKFNNGLLKLGVAREKIRFMDHHRAHAASAYRCSGFEDCVTISMDGFGPNGQGRNIAGQVYVCKNGHMELVEEMPLYITALYFSGFTVALDLKYMDGEGKTMGLAAYGDPEVCYNQVKELIFNFKDGRWHGYPYWIDYVMVPRKSVFVKTHTGRKIMRLIAQFGRENVAAAAQRVLEERMMDIVEWIHARHPFRNLALAGGIFLNVKVNKLIMELPYLDDLFIQPHAGDGGTAIGAALELYHELSGQPVNFKMQDAALGKAFDDTDIEATLHQFAGQLEWQKLNGTVPEYVGQQLARGKVIGWFQDREEWGPRALGRRSVLADPRRADTRDIINSKMKNREWFMPFAPSALYDHGARYFKNFRESNFMTLAFDVIEEKAQEIAAAIHVDKTARVHSVRRDLNPLYYSAIEAFFKETGVPVILNTSFNRHGLPIVHSPKDAIEHLLWGCVHELAIGSFIVRKK